MDLGLMSSDSDDRLPKIACKEARNTLDQQIKRNELFDEKAIGIFRANLLLSGLLLTVITLLIDSNNINSHRFLNAWSICGILFLVLSTILAAMAYTSSEYDLGIGIGVIEDVEDGQYGSEEALHDELQGLYKDWLKNNQRVGRINSYILTASILFVINAMIFLLGSVVIGVFSYHLTILSVGLLVLTLLILSLVDLVIWKADSIFASVF